MERNERILKYIDRNGIGIEIGPGYCPAAPKKDGFRVHSIDHMCAGDLAGKYSGHDVEVENIEEVDFVWSGEPYAELTGKRKFYDWIIASHLIEHTPDLVGFLRECDTILKDTGVISLVIPDKRYCFDRFRPLTSIARVIDSHLLGSRTHTPGTAAEALLYTVRKGGRIAWGAGSEGDYSLVHSLDEAAAKMEELSMEEKYEDYHAWCFVPHSFRLMIDDLYHLGFIPFREMDFSPTEGCGFYLVLSREGKGPGLSRLEMMGKIEAELREIDSSN